MTGIPLGNAPFGCVPSLRLKWKARRSVLGHQSLASLVRDDQFSSPRRETKKKSNVRSLGVFDQYFWTVRYLSTKLHMTTQHLKLDFWTKFRLNPILASKVLRKIHEILDFGQNLDWGAPRRGMATKILLFISGAEFKIRTYGHNFPNCQRKTKKWFQLKKIPMLNQWGGFWDWTFERWKDEVPNFAGILRIGNPIFGQNLVALP